jgi:TRAP-type mannitol/chloroaromatic compound transport system permease small subunit
MSANRSALGVGLTYFAAAMMIVVGAFDALQGLAAIIKESYFVVGENYCGS